MRTFLMLGLLAAGLAVAVPALAEEGQSTPGQGGQGGRQGQMMQQADKNGDGSISKDEFLAVAAERFARMDKNSDGRLTPDERPHRRERGERGQGQRSGTDAPPPPEVDRAQ